MSTPSAQDERYLVRVLLTDRSTIKAGGYKNRDTAIAQAHQWVSLETAESRYKNGAEQVILATVQTLNGTILDSFPVPVGETRRMRA